MKGEQDLVSRHGRATHTCQVEGTPRQRQGGVKCMMRLEKWEVSEHYPHLRSRVGVTALVVAGRGRGRHCCTGSILHSVINQVKSRLL